MSKIRVVFLGTPEFAVKALDALLADEHYEVVGVVTQPDRPSGRKLQLTPSAVKQRALEKGLPVISPETINKQEIRDEIATWGGEIAVVVAFGQILSEKFLRSFQFGAVNVHASLLPRWRGAAPIQRSIEVGDTETGVCLQVMVKKLDAGDVLGFRKVAITPFMNSLELHDVLALKGQELLHVELMDYVRGFLQPVPQNEELVTYAHKITKEESLLDWSKSAQDLHNKIRGFVWGPGTFTSYQGKRLKIHQTRVSKDSNASRQNGEVLSATDESICVSTGDGILEILELQPESRSRMTCKEFLQGHALKAGEKFGSTN